LFGYVNHAFISIRSNLRVNAYVDYQLTIQTRPGGALFEGTLRFDEETKNVQMMGENPAWSELRVMYVRSTLTDRHARWVIINQNYCI
jgi:hypothetical protein